MITIDPVLETAKAIAAIKEPTVSEVASSRGRLPPTSFTSPVVDMIPHPTDEIGIVVPPEHLPAYERLIERGSLWISHSMALTDFGPGWCDDPHCPQYKLGRHIHPHVPPPTDEQVEHAQRFSPSARL